MAKQTAAAKKKPKTLIRRPALLKKIPFSNSQVCEMIKAGEFPAPIKLSARAVAWIEEEVDDWIDSRERTTATAAS